MSGVEIWLLICAVCGAGYLLARAFNRRAEQTIRAHIDAATLHGDDWIEACANCLDCANDQAIGITLDGSHDTLTLNPLSMCERITFEEIERRLEETS